MKPVADPQDDRIGGDGLCEEDYESVFDPERIMTMGWTPRVFVYPSFLSEAECDHFIARGLKKGLERSRVVHDRQSESGTIRTSEGTFLGDDGDEISRRVEQRMAQWTQLPLEHGEHFYILRYSPGQEYKEHWDFFDPQLPEVRDPNAPGQRIMTILVYLNAPTSGGETSFPGLGLNIHATRGTAVLFHNVRPDHRIDTQALHAGQPVKEGIKWCLTKWFRERTDHQRRSLENPTDGLHYG